MTSKQVSEDNEKMSDTMYKLLKKYQAIRSIVKILHVSIDNLLSTKMFGKKLKVLSGTRFILASNHSI